MVDRFRSRRTVADIGVQSSTTPNPPLARLRHFSGGHGKPGKEIVDPRAAFKIFEQRVNRHSRATKYPGRFG